MREYYVESEREKYRENDGSTQFVDFRFAAEDGFEGSRPICSGMIRASIRRYAGIFMDHLHCKTSHVYGGAQYQNRHCANIFFVSVLGEKRLMEISECLFPILSAASGSLDKTVSKP